MNPIVITSAFILLLLLTQLESSEYREINKKLDEIENNKKDLDEIIQTSEIKIKYDELLVEMEENQKKLELLQKELEQELDENKDYRDKKENVETELTEVQKEERILRRNNTILYVLTEHKIIFITVSVLLLVSILIYRYRQYRNKFKTKSVLKLSSGSSPTSNKSAHYILERILVGGKVFVLLMAFVVVILKSINKYLEKHTSDKKVEEELQKTMTILNELSFWIVTVLFLIICFVILYMKSKDWKVVVTESTHTFRNFFSNDQSTGSRQEITVDIRMNDKEQQYTDSLAWWTSLLFVIQIILLVVSKYTDNTNYAMALLSS